MFFRIAGSHTWIMSANVSAAPGSGSVRCWAVSWWNAFQHLSIALFVFLPLHELWPLLSCLPSALQSLSLALKPSADLHTEARLGHCCFVSSDFSYRGQPSLSCCKQRSVSPQQETKSNCFISSSESFFSLTIITLTPCRNKTYSNVWPFLQRLLLFPLAALRTSSWNKV